MFFCDRLKEMRFGLEKNQTQMAELTGMSKRSYCAYESGETPPSPKLLIGLAEMGADVTYLLIGKPANSQTGMSIILTADQKKLLDRYTRCTKADQATILRMAEALAKA